MLEMSITDAQRACVQIKERIITTRMPPGSVIHETELMDELNLGRTPIREALKQLEVEKLVVVVPRRGIFVSEVSFTDLQDTQEIRIELDALCVRLAVERSSPAQITAMQCLVDQYVACDNQCDQQYLMNLDRRFHHLIAEAASNRLLMAESEIFYDLSLRIWHLYLDRLAPDDLDIDAFTEILAAMESKNIARADRAMRRHIRKFQEAIRGLL
jgi:GntR family transcriptional regulator, rspAB operon transcriptional repressor